MLDILMHKQTQHLQSLLLGYGCRSSAEPTGSDSVI